MRPVVYDLDAVVACVVVNDVQAIGVGVVCLEADACGLIGQFAAIVYIVCILPTMSLDLLHACSRLRAPVRHVVFLAD